MLESRVPDSRRDILKELMVHKNLEKRHWGQEHRTAGLLSHDIPSDGLYNVILLRTTDTTHSGNHHSQRNWLQRT